MHTVKDSLKQALPPRPMWRAIFSWALFDWANSAFSTIVTTFIFAPYFAKAIAKNEIVGTADWGDATALAGIIIAILSPILGAIADNEGRRKPWLAFFTLVNIVATGLLWFATPTPDSVFFTLICVIIATIGLEIGIVFYNSMLKDLAPEGYLGRLSGWAWGMGYAGGLVSLMIALFVFINHGEQWFNLSSYHGQHVRICGPLSAIWFALFCWPLFVFTPDHPRSGLGISRSVKKGLATLYRSLSTLNQYRNIMKFLLARLFYIDGLNTVFAFGGIYAAGTFNMSINEIIQLGICMNISAGIGAIIFGWLDDLKGGKLTIFIALMLILVTGIGILITHSKIVFWILGLALSSAVGPVQAASRSFMTRLSPPELITEMFGLYAFSGKVTAFMSPAILSVVTLWTQSQRIGMSTLFVFIAVGAIMLCFVKKPS